MGRARLRRGILACALGAWGCSEGNTPGGSGGGGSGSSGTTGGSTASGGSPGAAGTMVPGGTGAGATGGSAAGSGGSAAIAGGGGTTGGSGASGAGSGGAGSGGMAGQGGAAGTATAGVGGAAGGVAGGMAGMSGSGASGAAGTGGVTVALAQTRQTIDGFGINNTYAPGMDDATADALFDPVNGLGLTILRIGMSPNGTHANTASPDDIAKAKARGVQYIVGSTWSPPASCKTNNSTQNGGHLLESCYGSWSDTIAKFAADNDLYAMSPANEPDFASCGTAEPCNGVYDTTLYTANEMVAFLKVVGPKLEAVGVKLIGPEASEWLHAWSNDSACCSVGGKESSDPLNCGFPGTQCAEGEGYDYGHAIYKDATAWAELDILGVHQYDTQVAMPWPADVPERKPIWQTEMSGVKWWPEGTPSSDISNGVAVAGWLHNALTVGEANAWLWWWWKAQGATNEGLLLSDGTDTKRHYTFGNFTRFVRPGYTRVDVTGNDSADLLLSAYKGPAGQVVVVAINKGAAALSTPIAIAGGTAPTSMTPWVTSASDNLVAKTAVPVTGGSFTATLAGTTVTTFVSSP
jgi:glucuronoarabinoxylan endo-1,4-beta-xylanase